MVLSHRKIVLGVTGGIAAYKSAYLARLLIKAGAEVQVIMTRAGAKFVTPLTFESLTGRSVAVEMFAENTFVGTRHIDFAEWADLIVVAPATADFIAQIANGFCPELLSTVVCASNRPLLLAPAMNDVMWENPAVQTNVETLKNRGVFFANVGIGEMACRSFGPGRMAEPDEIFEHIASIIGKSGPLKDKKVIITAGPCREAIDPVRYISNRSSGKMGFALAIEAEKLGADVTLISGPTALLNPDRVTVVNTETTAEMAQAVQSHFANADYLVMAAAPADFTPTKPFDQKVKKNDSGMALELSPTIDILKSLKDKKTSGQTIIGFALETEYVLDNAKKKLADKNLDFIVVNDALEAGAAFDSDTNRVVIIAKDGRSTELKKADKDVIARNIWEYVLGDGRRTEGTA
ncbi:MAG: bifunctional phosphopantothenoylcysteine decarboxylase/phosphopantothenate--cysteine ligase CoaBC [Candidatus Zixiibacteriota bacterium]